MQKARPYMQDFASLHIGLCKLVQSFALGATVHQDESLDLELLTGLGDGFHPASFLGPLSVLELLLRHDVALDFAKFGLCVATLGVELSSVPHLAHGAGLALLSHSLAPAGLAGSLGGLGLGGAAGFL